MAGVVDTIFSVSQQYGIDPLIPLATAYQESHLNPTAVGDGGTSFGLFQLHEGGELGSHTPQWAFDPANNAGTAIPIMAQIAHAHPTWTPGEIAAAAQRPQNRTAYASSINNIYQQIKTGRLNVNAPVTGTGTGTAQATAAEDPFQFFSDPNNPITWPGQLFGLFQEPGRSSVLQDTQKTVGSVVNFLSLPNLGMRVFAGVLGLILISFGIYLLAEG